MAKQDNTKLTLMTDNQLNILSDELTFISTNILIELKPMVEEIKKASLHIDRMESIERNLHKYNTDIISKISANNIEKVSIGISKIEKQMQFTADKYNVLFDLYLDKHLKSASDFNDTITSAFSGGLKEIDIKQIELDIADRVFNQLIEERKYYLKNASFLGEGGYREITQEMIDKWHADGTYQIIEKQMNNSIKETIKLEQKNIKQANHLFIIYGIGIGIGIMTLVSYGMSL